MDDPQRKPSESERNALRDRIARAAAAGRISAADAGIRTTNVGSAQSAMELDLIARELDQLDQLVATPPASAPSDPTASSSGPAAPSNPWQPVPASSSGGSGRLVPLLILGFVVFLLVAGGIALFTFSSSETKSAGDPRPSLAEPLTPGASPVVEDTAEPAEPGEPGAPEGRPFTLDAAGIRGFLSVYRARFGTSKVLDLTMYDDYAIVEVPVPGKARHTGWIYRDGIWDEFGGTTANSASDGIVNLRNLDVGALLRNIAKARRTLNVEDYNLTYVVIRFMPVFDDVPDVNIYVSNEFHESGYLATRMDGSIRRAYPYAPPSM